MLARVLTAAVGIPILVFASLSESIWPLKIVIALLGLLCFVEFNSVEQILRKWWAWIIPVLFLVLAILWTPEEALFVKDGKYLIVLLTLWIFNQMTLGEYPFGSVLSAEKSVDRYVRAQFGWILFPLVLLIVLRAIDVPAEGTWWQLSGGTTLLLLFLCLWAGDTAGYLVGRAFGRHKMAPQISPQKTWEGASANLIGAVLTGFWAGPALGVGATAGLLIGLAVGVLGQLGDLAESAWKRSHGRKDSGVLLPGHGGILDRFDSLLFAAPVVTIIVYFFK